MEKTFVISHRVKHYRANDPGQNRSKLTIQVGHSEFVIEWVETGMEDDWVPRIQLFDNAFDAFVDCPELFSALAEFCGMGETIGRFARMLAGLGFTDNTPDSQV